MWCMIKNIEMPLKCPLPAGGRSGDTLTTEGEGWKVQADPRSYTVSIPGLFNAERQDHVSSDARTNLQRGYEVLRNRLSATKG